MSEHPAPPTMPDDFPADRVVGIILMALDALGGCGMLLLGSGVLGTNGRESESRAGAVALALLIALVVLGLVAFVHYGLYCGRRWAFIVGLLLSICGLAGSLGGQSSALSVVVGFSTMVYTALRLGGALGPRPE